MMDTIEKAKKDVDFKKIKTRVTKADSVIADIKIKTEVDLNEAVKMGTTLKKIEKDMKAKQKEFIDPLKLVIDKIKAEYKPTLDKLADLQNKIKLEMKIFQTKQQEKIRKENERIAEQNRKKEEKFQEKVNAGKEVAAPEFKPEKKATTNVQTSTGSAHQRKVWRWEVTDESKIPEKYKTLNRGEIGKAVRQGARDIPGVRIFQDTETAFRA